MQVITLLAELFPSNPRTTMFQLVNATINAAGDSTGFTSIDDLLWQI